MNWHYLHQDSFKLLRKKIIKENLAVFLNFIFILDLLLYCSFSAYFNLELLIGLLAIDTWINSRGKD